MGAATLFLFIVTQIAFFPFSYFYFSSFYILTIVTDLSEDSIGVETPPDFIRTTIMCFLCLVAFYPFVVLYIKRLRDIKLSYWLTLLALIPGIDTLFTIFLCLKGSAKKISKQSRKSSQRKQSKNKRNIRR